MNSGRWRIGSQAGEAAMRIRVGASLDRQKVPLPTDFAQWIEGRGDQEYFIYVPRVYNGNTDF